MNRDFIAEMDAQIEAATQGSNWVPAIVAEKLVAQLEADDPELLGGWLRAMAVTMLRRVIGLRVHAKRQHSRHNAGGRAFADAVDDAKNGDDAALRRIGMFSITHRVDDGNTQKLVGEMTGEDHLFVASDYGQQAKPLLMEEAFHKAVAKKVGSKRTSEVFTEAEYEAMYRSITGKAAA